MADSKQTSAGTIALAWLIVSIPLAWGVYNTGLGAAKLFTHLQQSPPAQTHTP